MQDNTNQQSSKDPADVWWNEARGGRVAAPAPEPVAPPVIEDEWRWRYSPWVGIMYGPIPVGLIIGIPLLLALTMK
jgi:hypothetical protein